MSTQPVTVTQGQVDTRPGSGGGVVQYDPNDGRKLNPGETVVDNTSPVIKNQSNIMQSTQSQTTKDNTNSSKIDQKVTSTYGAPASNTGSGSTLMPVPKYGDPVKDQNGNIVGYAKYDPNNSQPLQDPNNPGATKTEATDNKSLTTTPPSGFNYSLPPLEDGKTYKYSSDGHVYVDDGKGNVTLDPTGEQEYAKNAEENAKIAERNALYDSYKKGLDASHQALIDSIKAQADAQRKRMDDLNRRSLGLKEVQGYRTGAAEYTPEIETGILKKEEEEGLARLAEIDANMQIAIAQAVSAKTQNDFELLDKQLQQIDSMQRAKESAVQGIYKTYMDNAKYLDDKMKELDAAEKQQQDLSIKKADAISPGLVSGYNALKTDKEKQAFLDEVSKRTNVSTDILLGSIQGSLQKQKESDALVSSRNRSNQSGTKPTVSEQMKAVVGQYSSGFVPGQTFVNSNGQSISIIDPNGYANPEAFKNAISKAPSQGVSRTDFIKNFGYLVYIPDAIKFGLTPAEIKLLTGKLPADEEGNQ